MARLALLVLVLVLHAACKRSEAPATAPDATPVSSDAMPSVVPAGPPFPLESIPDLVNRKIVAVRDGKVGVFTAEAQETTAVVVYDVAGVARPQVFDLTDPLGQDRAGFAAGHAGKISSALAGFFATPCTPFDASGTAGTVKYDAARLALTRGGETIKLDNGGRSRVTPICAVELVGSVTLVLVDYDSEAHHEAVEFFRP